MYRYLYFKYVIVLCSNSAGALGPNFIGSAHRAIAAVGNVYTFIRPRPHGGRNSGTERKESQSAKFRIIRSTLIGFIAVPLPFRYSFHHRDAP